MKQPLSHSTIDELNKLTELNANIKNRKIKLILSSTKKVLEEAERMYSLGDEENAYIFYMKYFNLITIIQKSKEFPSHKLDLRETLGTNSDIGKRLDKLEKLKVSLQNRYAEKAESQRRQAELESNKENIEAKNAYATTASRNASPFILISSLYKHISDKSKTVLLMDCRSAQAFSESKINFPNMINIPEESIRNGLSADKLSKELPMSDQLLWSKRGDMDSIILIDELTSEQDKMDSLKAIWVLRDILINWDQDVTYKSIQLADGGFDKFLTTYPMHTTNPNYKPRSSLSTQIYPLLDGIEYPSVDDIKMKPKEITAPKYIPRIDRTSKPIYGQKSTEATFNPVAMAREKELMYDQVIKQEQEILTIGNELKRYASTPTIPNDIDQTEWYSKQTELENKFFQKEHELNDTICELNAVDQHEVENQMGTLQINKQTPELAELKARLDAKQKQFSQNERKVAEAKQEIETKMNIVRERQKRHLQQKEEEDELTRPKIPAIDRSSKPTFDRSVSQAQQVVYRDFSPEYGSYGEIGATGLKNLGNTCYMNSVIQCLLNYHRFCKYLKDDHYMKHINHKSKTRGKISVELAHLAKEIWTGKYKSVAPRDFRSAFGQEYKMFASYEQQDSHEFLVHLLDVLHSELQIDDPMVYAKADQGELAWREFVKNKTSIIQTNFYGQIRSTLKCCSCGFESATYDGFSHLSLELPQNSRQCYLHDCLDLYFNGEAIDGWTCPHCKSNRGAVKKLDISRLPPVLVIHFKRFYVSTSSNSIEKKQNFVHFPIVDFSSVDYVMPSERQRQNSLYNLIAVSNHYGTLNRGHYTAFCQNFGSKQWYKYDDNYVTQISSDDVSSSAGYILFYSNF